MRRDLVKVLHIHTILSNQVNDTVLSHDIVINQLHDIV